VCLRFRFVCEKSIEQRICKIQEEKLKLAENVLTGAKRVQAIKQLNINDLIDLFKV
jgi:SNF2 family DNA or RNA helicase